MKKYIIYSLVLFASAFSSCKKNFLDLPNPNQPTAASAALVLPSALSTSAAIVNASYTTYGFWMGYLAPAAGYAPSQSLLTYNFTTSDYQVWTSYYLNLSNYDYVIKQTNGNASQVYYNAIAQIMTAYNFQGLVDNYNDVPYTKAFQGSANLLPTYDKGPAIYADLIKRLDAAIAAIKGADDKVAVNPTSADIVFAGDMDKWKKFANTLKLRLILRQSNLPNFSAIAADIATTAAEGYLTVDAAANPGYQNIDGKQSPFWAAYGYSQAGSTNNAPTTAGTFGVNSFKNNADPRGPLFYQPNKDGDIVGNLFGVAVPVTASNFGNTTLSGGSFAKGTGLLKSPYMDANLLSASESYFLQSEAALKGLISTANGDAEALYKSGITASFETAYISYTGTNKIVAPGADSAAVKYYKQSKANINWEASSDKLQAIITQKYLALTGYNMLEAYNEYRRTGFPNVPASVANGALGGGKLPSRIFYPNSEYAQNAANVGAEGTINQFTSKIFWAK
jgi:hypothetical protein